MTSSTPRVVQITLDITLDERKFVNAPVHIAAISQQVAQAALKAVNDSPAAVHAVSVDVEWAWLYAWASGRTTVAAASGDDLDPEGIGG